MHNRKAKSGYFNSEKFIETHQNSFVGGKTYSKNISNSNRQILIVVILLIVSFISLYMYVPDFRFIINLFIG